MTLSSLRAKVAGSMNVSAEELSGSDVKHMIMETFQDFTLSKNIIEVPKVEEVKKKKEVKKEVKKEKKVKNEIKKEKEVKIKMSKPKKEKVDEAQDIKSSTKGVSGKSLQIEKLKSYVFKCGVRKVWKKELEGLSESQSIAKIQSILRELGIEGKPSLEQCKAIKAKREFEAEMREIDASNIIEGKRRRRSDDLTKKMIISESESENESESDNENESDHERLDLSALGDSESD